MVCFSAALRAFSMPASMVEGVIDLSSAWGAQEIKI
jgi:hypothetical protein